MAGEVLFWELDGYPKENLTRKKFDATRRIMCRWADRELMKWALLRHPGAVYPYIADWSVRCTGVGIEPYGGMQAFAGFDDLAAYEWAVITAKYESPDWGDPQPYPEGKDAVKHRDLTKVVSESLEPNVEAMKMDHRLFTWSDGTALKPDEAPIRTVYRMTYALTRHFQTSIPGAAITSVGKINSNTVEAVLLPGLSFDPHTLMYMPPSIDVSIDDDGIPRIDLGYRFAFKEEGWRKFWRGDTKGYDTMKLKSSGGAYDKPEAIDFGVFWP